MLDVRLLSVNYGKHRALDDVSIRVDKGEIVVILGANGAGKSTLLNAIGGMNAGSVQGEVLIDGVPSLGAPPHRIVEAGVSLVPEGRALFGELTVRENLLLGAYAERARADQQANLERVLVLFPKLRERLQQGVRTMSGGEQQMVAIGRAMMSAPSILMLDEPSLGLSPLLCKELFRSLAAVRGSGLGILLVEQNAKQSLAIADRGYLIENSRIICAASAANLVKDPAVQQAYLGAGGPASATAPRSLEPGERTMIRPPTQPTRRVPSDALLPETVATLVSRATAIQARHAPSAPHAETRPAANSLATDAGHHDELREVLAEIERAAAAARLPRRAAETDPGQRHPFIKVRT